jgi:SAM-dependent methyltransferase
LTGGLDRDLGRFDRRAADYDQDRLQGRFFGPVHARTVELITAAGALPFADASFDLVVSTVSFHHWHSQHAGIWGGSVQQAAWLGKMLSSP